MTRFDRIGVSLAAVMALAVLTHAQSQTPPQTPPAGGGQGGAQGGPPQGGGGMFAPPQGLPPVRNVHITGENPGLQLREKANGPIIADFNFWRVNWSPIGVGHVCYLTTGDGTGPNDLRIVLTDNEKLEKYVTDDTMSKLVPNFGTPAYKVITGAKFSWTGDTLNERTEHCDSKEYKIAATWRKITPGRFGGMQPNNGFFMNFIIHMAAEGEITVNGKRLPGTVLPGPGRPPSYLAFAETWLK